MSTCTLNGLDVYEGRICMPRIGVWTADLAVNTDDPTTLTDKSTLSLQDSEGNAQLSLVGTAFRKGEQFGTVTARMVGGAAGLGQTLPPKFYKGVPLRLPLQDLVGSAGEALSPAADPGVLGGFLAQWTRGLATAADCLTALLGAAPAGTAWRILPDGTLWVGPETWPATSSPAPDVLEDSEYLGTQDLGVEVPTLLPGTTLGGRNVSYVEHTIHEGKTRTQAWFETGAPTLDRAKQGLAAFIRSVNSRQMYLGQFPGTVVQQRADLSLDVQMDDPRIPGLTSLPIRTATPGLVVKVAPKTRVMVAFENGDPSAPVAELFGPGTALEVDLVANLVKIGAAPSDFAVKGTTYLGAEAIALATVNAFLATILSPGPLTAAHVAAAKAANIALTLFLGSQQPTFLSTAVQLQ